jgi:hypothetical protein
MRRVALTAIGRMPMTLGTTAGGTLRVAWGTARATAPFTVG